MYQQSDWFATVALNVFGNSTTETVHAVRMVFRYVEFDYGVKILFYTALVFFYSI